MDFSKEEMREAARKVSADKNRQKQDEAKMLRELYTLAHPRDDGWWAFGKFMAAMILGPILIAIPLIAIWVVWTLLATGQFPAP